MYNGIGLQTPRGSGTNGYIQTNKFFVKSRPLKAEFREFQNGQGEGGVSRKANKEILEHERKRQIQLKLTQLEDQLIEEGFSLEDIAAQVEALRKNLEDSKSETHTPPTKLSETQSHQIAAKKEKELDVMKAALGIKDFKEGEAFDRDLQEQRKQERILAREEKERERKEKQLEAEQEARRKEKQERRERKEKELEAEKEIRRKEKEERRLEREKKKAERKVEKEIEREEREKRKRGSWKEKEDRKRRKSRG